MESPPASPRSTPVVLSVAGSDCSAGAGLQADLKTAFALGCYPLTAVTCVVSEVPGCVEAIAPLSADFVASQVRLCLRRFPVCAIKTGMLYSPDIVCAVAEELAPTHLPLVVDPVMVATAGEPLMRREAVRNYEERLFPLATVLTPNRDELETLLDGSSLRTEDELEAAARQLAVRSRCAVLAKGGHLEGNVCTDILAPAPGTRDHPRRWRHPRTLGVSTHGTGCTLSSAVAAGLAHGLPLAVAVEQAILYTARAIAASLRLGEVDALDHGHSAFLSSLAG